jgi:hypothetical protein
MYVKFIYLLLLLFFFFEKMATVMSCNALDTAH